MIGIDLGTTNSLVAFWDGERPVLIPNAFGDTLTPSIVSVDESGEILTGAIARERLITHPRLTAAAFKRFMGTEKEYSLGRYSFSPTELSSFILKTLKSDAEAYLGQPVEEAVISVPAYFNDTQRKATKQAAELAGLKVERLISEPTAAALAYGLHQEEEETRFLVFDLGGGTFDVSILERFEGVMEVKSIAGDNFLGGEDFTELLVAHFTERTGIALESLDHKMRSVLNKQAEQCKRSLGAETAADITIVSEGKEYSLRIDKTAWEQLAQPLLVRLRRPVERALHDAGLKPSELDGIVMIGGATRMPLVKHTVGRMFGQIPYVTINPDETVALGAAIQAALKQRDQALDEIVLTDVCPYTLGTDVLTRNENGQAIGVQYFPIIERNTPIPVSRVERVQTAYDKQKQVNVDIYQGESRRVENNLKLGELTITVPPAPAGEQKIDIRYTYDINGILEVEVTSVQTGEKQRLVIEQHQNTMTKEEIDERLRQLADLKIHPRDRSENRLLLARGERLFEESLGEDREYIARCLTAFEAALETQDDRIIKKAVKEYTQRLEQLEGWNYFT